MTWWVILISPDFFDFLTVFMAYTWENRIKFLVRYMYDIDNNGVLDKADFDCLAVRNTLVEGKGEWSNERFEKNKEIMSNLWEEISALADFNQVLIHLANPQPRPLVITVFAHVVRTYVRAHFSNLANKKQHKMVATGETVGLAEWIVDDTCLVVFHIGNKLQHVQVVVC